MGTENDDVSTNIDIEAASDTLASDLGLGDENSGAGSSSSSPEPEKDVKKEVAQPDPKVATVVAATPDPAATAVRAVPKSWPKETHDYWGKLDPKVQELVERREKDFLDGIEQYKGDAGFAKQIRETLAPYQALMTAQNITDPAVAVRGLLNAHYQLSQPDEAARISFMTNLLKQYSIDPEKLFAATKSTSEISDPTMLAMKKQIDNLSTSMSAEQTRQVAEVKAKLDAEVAAFATDPAHPYFEEVATEIAVLIRGQNLDLKEAYERAVRANPQTWAKEQDRIRKEIETDVRTKAEEEARKSREAKGTNVRGRESQKAPTEVLGTMDDTLRSTYKEIVNRT